MPSQQYLAFAERLKARDTAAAPEMLALAKAGDADALFKAAELHMRGMAGPVDLKSAFRLTGQAAARNGWPPGGSAGRIISGAEAAAGLHRHRNRSGSPGQSRGHRLTS
jgi:TPR repeat protein